MAELERSPPNLIFGTEEVEVLELLHSHTAYVLSKVVKVCYIWYRAIPYILPLLRLCVSILSPVLILLHILQPSLVSRHSLTRNESRSDTSRFNDSVTALTCTCIENNIDDPRSLTEKSQKHKTEPVHSSFLISNQSFDHSLRIITFLFEWWDHKL